MQKITKLIKVIKNQSIIFLACIILVLVITNAGFLIYNNQVLAKTTDIQNQTAFIKNTLNLMWDNVVRNIDLGIRGYALTKDPGLQFPYQQAIIVYDGYQRNLHNALIEQGYPDMQGFEVVKKGYDDYITFAKYMFQLTDNDEMDMFTAELKKDKGLTLWKLYEKYSNEVNAYQDKLNTEASIRYTKANRRMSIIQLLLGIIGAPTLLFMILKIIKNEKGRKSLFEELEDNNRKYLYDPGNSETEHNERNIINNSIINLKKATNFINHISTGNLEVKWEGLSEKNIENNQKNLAGELVQMREKMKQLKAEDSKRMWSTEGQAKFSEVIRTYQHNLRILCDNAVSFIVKYLSAQQGAIYILRDADDDDKHLELVSCYAFNKKKHVEKRIEIGQGIVGQVYLEQLPVMLKEIPQGYTYITSGLGDATPTCLLVVPMKYNEKVDAIIEIASFQTFEKHQLEWLEKIGEIMASTLISIKTTEKTQMLLDQFKEQTEQLKAQEEELRQNMEELEATQEEMRRKELELSKKQKEMQR